jgi:AGZA family xanthine/uracil permease-like MFS transporter
MPVCQVIACVELIWIITVQPSRSVSDMSGRYPLFVKRDLDGFFGLAVDNLVQLLLIVTLCSSFCGMVGDDADFIYKHILPGAAVSLVIGNIFYALQAHWVARRDGKSDVTALPYGINTPSLLVYIFFVMMPAYKDTQSAAFAWRMGLIACLGSGVIEFAGAFVAERLRRNSPRAALLSTLAAIAITFIAMKFALEIWVRPLVAMVPMGVIFLVYFSRVRFPLGLPGGFIAVVIGTAAAWLLSVLNVTTGVPMSVETVQEEIGRAGTYWPIWVGPVIWDTLNANRAQIISMLSVIIPMGLFNVIGSLQNIESAEASGDVYPTGPSLAVNGLGTIAASLFGSCFPTTIYIGHPGWKALGARAGYSTLNGFVMTAICLTGTVAAISAIVPIEAGIAIVLWIGIVITAQAFQTTPVRHAPAVAVGLFPAIAAWGATIVAGSFDQARCNTVLPPVAETVAVSTMPSDAETEGTTTAAAAEISTQPESKTQSASVDQPGDTAADAVAVVTMQDLLESDQPMLGQRTEVNGFLIHGLNIMERGYIFTCMIVAAIAAFLIDRKYYHAAGWSLAGAVLTLFGLMHAYQLQGNTLDYWLIGTNVPESAYSYPAYQLVIGYALMGLVFAWRGRQEKRARAEGASLAEGRVVDQIPEPPARPQ